MLEIVPSSRKKCTANQVCSFYGKTTILLAIYFSDRDLGSI